MHNLFDNLVIQPLIEVYNVLFTSAYGLIGEPVFSVMALSILINFLSLPLYRKADQIQREEIEKTRKMNHWLTHIKKNFSGDERFMMQSAYYRIEHYNPLSVLKEAGPLLLQVPFFVAAYRFISSITLLESATFGPIHNLLKPDGLITIAGYNINILPIIMTIINCISGYIYSKNALLRQKVQIYGLALLFLILLYDSPSGLVIYWIMNNIFSLCKNIYFQLQTKEKKIFTIVGVALLAIFIPCCMLNGSIDTPADIFLSICIMVYAIAKIVITALQMKQVRQPGALTLIKGKLAFLSKSIMPSQIILVELCLSLLLGFYIPSSVIASSPVEFVDMASGSFQSNLLSYPATVYTGLFLLWMTVIILSRNGRKRTALALGLCFLMGNALFNQFFAPAPTGTLYSDLSFDGTLSFSINDILFNIIFGLLISSVLGYLFLYKPELSKRITLIISATLFFLFVRNLWTINTEINRAQVNPEKNEADTPITLSKNEKNVVVMMLDRAIGAYVPYIFDEKPELKESYRGFVFYPNTISFGAHTNYGAPPLFGGYEYTPYESNKHPEKTLKDKHDEALKLMPILFLNNGYNVTVCDPPYAGYKQIPDLSIYNDYPEIHTYNLTGKFSSEFNATIKGDPKVRQKQNFLYYSIFRTAPFFMKNVIYNHGDYLSNSNKANYTQAVLDSYSVLWKLPSLTSIADTDQGNALIFQNGLPHNPTILNPPGYAVDGEPIDSDYDHGNRVFGGKVLKLDNDDYWGHYCINVATYQAIAEWLDYLKENDVYDNTRIIFVADHGYYLSQFDDLIHPDGLDIESINPLLMVKDFNSEQEFSTDYTFMTNADVPSLAMKDIIANPVNPFTGSPVDNLMKYDGEMIITDSRNYNIEKNNGTVFDLDGGSWWSVHDSIFDMNNWKKLDEEEAK